MAVLLMYALSAWNFEIKKLAYIRGNTIILIEPAEHQSPNKENQSIKMNFFNIIKMVG